MDSECRIDINWTQLFQPISEFEIKFVEAAKMYCKRIAGTIIVMCLFAGTELIRRHAIRKLFIRFIVE